MDNIGEQRRGRFVACQLSGEDSNEWKLQCTHLEAQDMDRVRDLIVDTRHVLDHRLKVQKSQNPTFRNCNTTSSQYEASRSTSHQDHSIEGVPLISIK